MATKKKHIEQYNHNYKFLRESISSEFLDWSITIRFYCAVHIIEAILDGEKGMGSHNHKQREQLFQSIEGYTECMWDYLDLYQLSRKARYECINITQKDATEALQDLQSVQAFGVKKGLPID